MNGLYYCCIKIRNRIFCTVLAIALSMEHDYKKKDGRDSWRCLFRADESSTGTMTRQMDGLDPTNSVRIRLSDKKWYLGHDQSEMSKLLILSSFVYNVHLLVGAKNSNLPSPNSFSHGCLWFKGDVVGWIDFGCGGPSLYVFGEPLPLIQAFCGSYFLVVSSSSMRIFELWWGCLFFSVFWVEVMGLSLCL